MTFFSARQLLGLIAGPAIVVAFQASPVLHASVITIDGQSSAVLPPILKNKLGVARATGVQQLPASIGMTRQLGSRAFCTTISFDSLSGEIRDNYALGATQFSSDRVLVDSEARRWLQSLLQSLAKQNQITYIGVVGAPRPFQVATIRKPAAHPTPTDIQGAAQLTANWARQVIPPGLAVNWVIWNEPEHTLRGANTSVAAKEMAAIYRAYQAQLDSHSYLDGFGLASFMKASLRNTSDVPSQSFVQVLLNDLQRKPRPRIDYITLNNYHGETFRLIERVEADLGRAGLDVPLQFTQFAPEIIGSKPAVAGSIDAASHYLNALDRFVQSPNVNSVCLSFWTGPDRKALLREQNGYLKPTLPFQALAMYQRLPLWRIPIKGLPSSSPFTIWAGADEARLGVLVAPRPSDPAKDALPRTDDKAANKQARKSERKRLRREEKRSQISDGLAESTPTTTSAVRKENLQFKFTSRPNALFTLQRIRDGLTGLQSEQVKSDGQGLLTLAVASNEIVMLTTGEGKASAALLPQIRSSVYIHRRNPRSTGFGSVQAGVAAVDALADGFVLALPSSQSIAHASATFAVTSLGSELPLSWRSPSGSAGRANGLRCTAAVLQSFQGDKPIDFTAWGHPEAVRRILDSRAFAGGKSVMPTVSAWPNLDATGRMVLPVPKNPKASAVQLHLASYGCKPGTQLQIRPVL